MKSSNIVSGRCTCSALSGHPVNLTVHNKVITPLDLLRTFWLKMVILVTCLVCVLYPQSDLVWMIS